MGALDTSDPSLGGLLVAEGGSAGSLVDRPGQLQYGDLLTGAGTSAGWRELVGWRDLPEAQISDAERPQTTGYYAGDVFGGELTVTYTYMLRGGPDAKTHAANTLERFWPMDGVERPLVVNDGDGAWWRLARVIGRTVPQDKSYRVGPVECSVQFLCADPRRYSLTPHTGSVRLPSSANGLVYPLVYPLTYGVSSSGQLGTRNNGAVATPLQVVLQGPLTNPILSGPGWRLGFNLVLADGDSLAVDTNAGTVLLNGSADRLYTIRNDSDPLERCLLAPGSASLSLSAVTGTGSATVTYYDARM